MGDGQAPCVRVARYSLTLVPVHLIKSPDFDLFIFFFNQIVKTQVDSFPMKHYEFFAYEKKKTDPRLSRVATACQPLASPYVCTKFRAAIMIRTENASKGHDPLCGVFAAVSA